LLGEYILWVETIFTGGVYIVGRVSWQSEKAEYILCDILRDMKALEQVPVWMDGTIFFCNIVCRS